MKFLLTILTFVNLTFLSFSQGEEIGPLTINPSLYSADKVSILKAGSTFDSTFIYISDTLSLPFFDEFSKNLFQQYNADYGDAGVTSDKKYRLLDNITSLPISNDFTATAQQTFRRTYDLNTATFIDQNFDDSIVKVGDLSVYPVVYTPTSTYPPFYIYDTIGAPDIPDTVWIVGPEFYQDSATQFFAPVIAPNSLWLDHFAYHNFRYGVEPRSLGVVTFDGLDENGYPYAIGSTITNYADFLTSKPLDLLPFDAADSVYFSFLYQKQGFGDVPEEGDSLVLEFFAKDLDQWFRVWSVNGGPTEPFKSATVGLTDAKYFKKGFQFRFKNYGSQAGSLDHFHIDYVHLRPLSGYQDTLFKDFAFSYPIGSLLKTYTSVPWDHFKNNSLGKMNDLTEVVVHNGSNLTENNQNGAIEISYGGSPEGNFTMIAQDLSGGFINYGPRTTYYSEHDLSGGYVYDITKPGTQVEFDILANASAQFPNFPGNDSTSATQKFSNYYSYDDGSAEAAYGPTGAQARLAIKYTAYEEDSLIGVNMHFVPSVNDVSDNLFLITVWDDNGGVPGTVLYQDEAFFPRQPVYGNSYNTFVTYYFKDTMKVAVGETFYVGWRQFDAERLNIGLDRNLDNKTKTYYSINNGVNWSTSNFDGSVMIRPIFSTSVDAELQVPTISEDEILVSIFPNPTSNVVSINVTGANYEGADLYSTDGRLINSTEESIVDMSSFPNGIYFIRLKGLNTKAYKVIKN